MRKYIERDVIPLPEVIWMVLVSWCCIWRVCLLLIIFCVDSSLTSLSLLRPRTPLVILCSCPHTQSRMTWSDVFSELADMYSVHVNWRTCILPMLTCLSRRNKTQLSSPDWYRLVLMWTLFQSCSIWVTTLVNTLFGNMSVLSFNLLNHLTVVLNWHYDIYTKFIGNFILFFVSTSFTAHM